VTMDSRHQRGGRTGVGMFAGFLTGFFWFFLSFAAMFNGVFFFLLVAASRVRAIGSAPRVALPPSSDSCGVLSRRVGVTLGGLVVARNHLKLRLAEVLSMAGPPCDGFWDECARCAPRGCQTAS
jgi:hypothetical protein